MTKIPLFQIHRKFTPFKSIYSTNKGEVRYFIIDGEDCERTIRATGTVDGGLRIEQLIGEEWEINTCALPRLGDAVWEVPLIK